MAARKRTITKLTLAFATACLLTIPSAPVLSQNANQLFQQGNAAHNRGDFAEAESIFRQVLKIRPDSSNTYNNLGSALYSQGKLDEAIANYQKAIKLNPNNSAPYDGLGNALRAIQNINYPMM